MLRFAVRGGLFVLLAALVLDSTGRGQIGGGGDKVYFRKKGTGEIKNVTGELTETAAGVEVKSGGKTVEKLSPAEVIKITPSNDLPGLSTGVIRDLDAAEEKRDFAKAKDGYEAALKAPAATAKTKQFAEGRLLFLRLRLLDDQADPKVRDADAKALAESIKTYLALYPKAWEQWQFRKALARLQFEAGDSDGVRKTWAEVGKTEGLPADLKEEAGLNELDAMIRDRKYRDAATRAAEVAKSVKEAGPTRDRLTIYEAAAKAADGGDPTAGVAAVQKVIDESKDPSVRGTGYAMLGELFLAANKPRDAMWAYLWVEVVFNQDRDEVIKAMTRLAKVYQDLGDTEKAEGCLERMRRYKASS